jgi:hypothetical protein
MENDGAFVVDCNSVIDGQETIFYWEDRGEIVPLQGRFMVHQLEPGRGTVDVECFDPRFRVSLATIGGMAFHLSQPHVDSIIPSELPNSSAKHMIQIPFLSRHYKPSTANHQAAS